MGGEASGMKVSSIERGAVRPEFTFFLGERGLCIIRRRGESDDFRKGRGEREVAGGEEKRDFHFYE